MRTSTDFSFKSLLANAVRGQPLTLPGLAAQGLTSKHAARLAQSGWLVRRGHGVYSLPGDTLDRDACLSVLAASVPGLHVGGKTALAWRGVRHNLSTREVLSLWGDKSTKLPGWFAQGFPCHYQAAHLFDDALPASIGLAPLPGGRQDVLVSTPERAVLELLSDVGKRQTLEEARHLVEGARMLRLPVLEELLSSLVRIKVARLACELAEELDLPWKSLAQKYSRRLGGGARWVSVGKTGERLDLSLKR